MTSTAPTVKEKQLYFRFRSLKCGSESINILLTGKTGVGKSSLINAIIGEILADEGKSLGGQTRDVTCHERIVNHIKFKVWDSPGLQDITEKDGNITERIMQTLRQYCSHLHLFLYCIRMDRDRVEISELQAIKQLSQLFSPKIWDSAIFALTFANRVVPPPEKETDEEEAQWFTERIKEFKEVIVDALVENGVPINKAKQVPVIPTGYHKPTKHMPNPRKLFDRPDWFNPFWHSCARQMEENTIMALLASQRHRVQVVKGKTRSDKAQELAEKRQELKRKEMELKDELRKQQFKLEKECEQLEEAEEMRMIEGQSGMMENCKVRENDQREEENHPQHRQGEYDDDQTQLEEQRQERQIQIKNEQEQQKRRLEEQERRKKELENDYDRITEDYRRVEEELMKLTEAQTTTTESHDWKIEVSDSSSWAALIEKTNNTSPDEFKEEVKPIENFSNTSPDEFKKKVKPLENFSNTSPDEFKEEVKPMENFSNTSPDELKEEVKPIEKGNVSGLSVQMNFLSPHPVKDSQKPVVPLKPKGYKPPVSPKPKMKRNWTKTTVEQPPDGKD